MPGPTQPDLASDESLVRAARAGDARAFASLIERHHGLVRALVSRAGTTRAEAEDLAQEAWLAAWRRLSEVRDTARWKGWLAEVALNAGRQRARRRRVEEAAAPRLRMQARRASPDGGEPDALEAEEERRAVLEALDELPEEARALVLARYVEGRSAPEIAASLGVAPDAIRARLSRTLRSLRERLTALFAAERAGGRER